MHENKKVLKKYEEVREGIKKRLLAIIIRSVFSKGSKFYPQLFLDDALYELKNCYGIKKLMFQKELI